MRTSFHCMITPAWNAALFTCTFAIALAFHASTPLAADGMESEALRRDILAMDARLSDAYSACHTRHLNALFADDAELIFSKRGRLHSVTEHIDQLRRTDCAMRRETATETHWVEALPGHLGAIDGAIQVGEQTFCARYSEPCRGVSTRFIAIWRRNDDGWRIEQLIRYGYTASP